MDAPADLAELRKLMEALLRLHDWQGQLLHEARALASPVVSRRTRKPPDPGAADPRTRKPGGGR